jgi:selenocysteine lyase/cysteine desulfurase
VCLEGLSKLPVDLITPNLPGHLAGIMAFRHPDAARIHQHLLARNIHVMHQAGRIRIAIHGYNTLADIERLLAELNAVVS